MLLAGGNEEITYDVSSATLDTEFIGILPNGRKCSPWQNDTTIPSGSCNNCVGVAYASKKGRWIFRCGGKNSNGACKKYNVVI